MILENVVGAPWQQIADRWEQHGYIASFTNMDAKHYYIPHTRTRKYLVAVRQGGPVKHTSEGRHKSRKYGRTEADCPDFPDFEEDWMDGIKQLQGPNSIENILRLALKNLSSFGFTFPIYATNTMHIGYMVHSRQ